MVSAMRICDAVIAVALVRGLRMFWRGKRSPNLVGSRGIPSPPSAGVMMLPPSCGTACVWAVRSIPFVAAHIWVFRTVPQLRSRGHSSFRHDLLLYTVNGQPIPCHRRRGRSSGAGGCVGWNGPVFIMTCVVARLTFFLKPVEQPRSVVLSSRVRGRSRGSQLAEGGGGGVASYLPTTCWAMVWSEYLNRIGVEQGVLCVVF